MIKNWIASVACGILAGLVVGWGLIALEASGYEAGLKAGREQVTELANWVMYPTTLEEAEAEKHKCERITQQTCVVFGSFIPESMVMPKTEKKAEKSKSI